MQQTLQEFTEQTIGKKVWNIRQQLTSMVVFELGKKMKDGDGEYHYWVNCCNWWLKQGKGKEFEDIVNSESSSENIAKKITVLEGKKLLNINFNPENASTFFDFEDDLFLEMSPYGNNQLLPQWYLFKAHEVLEVRSDGTYLIKDPDERESLSSHQIKKENTPEKSQQEMDRRVKLLNDLAKKAVVHFDLEKISEADGKKLFSYIIKEYREGLVSVDDLSSLCELMYGKFDTLSETYSHLLNGAEIEWDIRNQPISAGHSISEILEFFK